MVKRKHSESEDSSEEGIEKELRTVTKTENNNEEKLPSAKKVKKMSLFQEQILQLQLKQIETVRESEERQQNMLERVLEEQRKSEEKERQKDREFFLEIGKHFSK